MSVVEPSDTEARKTSGRWASSPAIATNSSRSHKEHTARSRSASGIFLPLLLRTTNPRPPPQNQCSASCLLPPSEQTDYLVGGCTRVPCTPRTPLTKRRIPRRDTPRKTPSCLSIDARPGHTKGLVDDTAAAAAAAAAKTRRTPPNEHAEKKNIAARACRNSPPYPIVVPL